MVNTGMPSRDCHTCRRRRVKCDLRRPGCHRCEKIGQECTGYRDLDKPGLVFRVHTPTSYLSRRKGRKSHEQAHLTRNAEADGVQKELYGRFDTRIIKLDYPEERMRDVDRFFQSSWTPSPSRQLIESWEMHIEPLIVSQFSFAIPGCGRVYGSLECIHGLLKDAKTDSVLYIASQAVAYAYFANKTQSWDLMATRRARYGQSLHALRHALLDPVLQKQDSTVLAVWLLCFYELMKGDESEDEEPGPISWDIHSRAMTGLLRLRGRQQFQSKQGCQVFQLAYHTIQINSLQKRCEPPEEAAEWFTAIKSSGYIDDVIFVPIFVLCDEAVRIAIAARTKAQEASLEDILSAATSLIQDCNDLENKIFEKYGQRLRCSLVGAAAIPVINGHRDVQNLRVRNYIDGTFLRLYYSILGLLLHAAMLPEQSIDQSEEIQRLRQLQILQSQARADRILATLPIFLPDSNVPHTTDRLVPVTCWADTMRLLWQMRVIAASPIVLEKQKNEADQALSRMGYEVGLMAALGTYMPSANVYKAL